MAYDKALVAGKLRRWESYLDSFRLPSWEEIPDFGLYMEQVTVLLKEYLDYFPPELKEEQFITASTINNYVRTKLMPSPRKKRYYRVHIAYLIIILTLKQSLSMALIHKVIPMGLTEAEVRKKYETYVQQHRIATRHFADQVRLLAAPILDREPVGDRAVHTSYDLVTHSLIISGFARLLAEKLILLEVEDPVRLQSEIEGYDYED